ncbi:hypothetical protein ENUP19_0344G0015 [Entamoeba nuttalli]|uniref:Uncharacterized protein n=1 Tax=Entamoeba nuttalli TaxID=412467 RepID=A0ABQ0DXI5_9EUKA
MKKLQDILVPESYYYSFICMDYYHKIHIGARTNRSDNKVGNEKYEMMKNVYNQLKQWGTSDDQTDYEKVLLRVSPDDDKINHFKTIKGNIKYYKK